MYSSISTVIVEKQSCLEAYHTLFLYNRTKDRAVIYNSHNIEKVIQTKPCGCFILSRELPPGDLEKIGKACFN